MVDVGSSDLKIIHASFRPDHEEHGEDGHGPNLTGFITGTDLVTLKNKEAETLLKNIADVVKATDLMYQDEKGQRPGQGGGEADEEEDVAKHRRLCKELTDHIDKALKGTDFLKTIGSAKVNVNDINVFVIGTQAMRSWRSELEPKHGGRATELLAAIGDFCSRDPANRCAETRAVGFIVVVCFANAVLFRKNVFFANPQSRPPPCVGAPAQTFGA